MSVEDLHEYIIDLKQTITQAQLEIRIKQEAIKGAKDFFKKKQLHKNNSVLMSIII